MKKTYICLISFKAILVDHQSYTTYTGEVLQCNLQDGKDVEDVLNMVKKDWYALIILSEMGKFKNEDTQLKNATNI